MNNECKCLERNYYVIINAFMYIMNSSKRLNVFCVQCGQATKPSSYITNY